MAKASRKPAAKAAKVSRSRKVAVKDIPPTRARARKVVGGFVDIGGWDEVPLGARKTIKR